MGSSGIIEHLGVISEVSGSIVRVSVTSEPACGNCHARGSCSVGGNNEKVIEVLPPPGEKYSPGEQIKVILEQTLGIKALILGYLLPFLVVLANLIILTVLGVNEGLAGLLSLAILVPYYLCLAFFKDRLKKEFSFRLQKIVTVF
jgi:positive regulator of sigma E activity